MYLFCSYLDKFLYFLYTVDYSSCLKCSMAFMMNNKFFIFEKPIITDYYESNKGVFL